MLHKKGKDRKQQPHFSLQTQIWLFRNLIHLTLYFAESWITAKKCKSDIEEDKKQKRAMKSNRGQQLEAAQHEGVKIGICPIILLEDFFLNQRHKCSVLGKLWFPLQLGTDLWPGTDPLCAAVAHSSHTQGYRATRSNKILRGFWLVSFLYVNKCQCKDNYASHHTHTLEPNV